MKEWYGVKSLFRSRVDDDPTHRVHVEERIIVVRAASDEEARELAAASARACAASGDYTNELGERVVTDFLGHCHVFWIGDAVSDATEVFGRVWFVGPDVTPEELLKEHMGHGQGNDVDPRFVPRSVTR